MVGSFVLGSEFAGHPGVGRRQAGSDRIAVAMIAIVRITVWAVVGGLWGAAIATRVSTDWSHAARVGTTIGVIAGAVAGLAMHVLMRWIRDRRRKKGPDG